jgi:hypothetical protein
MCIHTSRIDIAMHLLQRIGYPQFSSAQFVVDKKSFLGNQGVNTFSAVKIFQFLHLVKEVSGAYNRPIVFLFGLWGSFQTAPQSFNHAFTSFGTITIWLESTEVEYNHGYSQPELNKILKLTRQNTAKLLEVWNGYFNK